MKRFKQRRRPGDGYDLYDLDDCFDQAWKSLLEMLDSGNYIAGQTKWFSVNKANGEKRWIAHLPAIERVFHRVLMMAIRDDSEFVFSSRSYAYRPGRSTGNAVIHLAQDMGNARFLVRVDIKNCFPSIQHSEVMDGLGLLKVGSDLGEMILSVIGKMESGPNQEFEFECGLVQGSPLSPLLCNLVLHKFDTALENAKLKFVRYADDVAISARNEQEGILILEKVKQILESMGLQLNLEKSQVLPAEEGDFLGYTFQRNRPGGWIPTVSPVNRLRFIAYAEKCGEASRSCGGDLNVLATKLGEIYSEWTRHYKMSTDQKSLQLAAQELRDVLRAEVWMRFQSVEAKEEFLRRRNIDEESIKISCNHSVQHGELPMQVMRRAMPRRNFSRFGLDGHRLLSCSGKQRISYDGRPIQ